jgi:hypothetical protein
MADPTDPEPVKAILALLWSDPERRESALKAAADAWGPIDHLGPDHLFQETDFYAGEMGRPLFRRILSFEPLCPPDFLPDAKHAANDVENSLRRPQGRTVNLDVGALDHNKVVLASMKPAGQKIYLSRGVYADLVLRYRSGAYRPLEWTFLDLRDGRYQADFLRIRRIYLRQRKAKLGAV